MGSCGYVSSMPSKGTVICVDPFQCLPSSSTNREEVDDRKMLVLRPESQEDALQDLADRHRRPDLTTFPENRACPCPAVRGLAR